MIDLLTFKFVTNAMERNLYEFAPTMLCEYDYKLKEHVFSLLGVVANEIGLLVPEKKTGIPVHRFGADWGNNLSPHTVFMPPSTLPIDVQAQLSVLNGRATSWDDLIGPWVALQGEIVGAS